MRPGWESWGCSAWGREGSGDTLLKGAYEKNGDTLFSGVCSDKTKGNGFKLRVDLDWAKDIFYSEGGEVLA